MVKKSGLIVLVCLTLLFSLSFVSALTIEQTTISDVVAKELKRPATFLLTIDNSGGNDAYIEFTSFIDISLSPKGSVLIPKNSIQEVILEVYPGDRIKRQETGGYTFAYYVKDGAGKLTEERAIIKILSLKDIIYLNFSAPLALDSTVFPIEVTNKENINLSKIVLNIESNFFEANDTFSLAPYETKKIEVKINPDTIQAVKAGKYLVTTIMVVNDEGTVEQYSKITVEEKMNIETTTTERGFLFFPIIKITKTNIGTVTTTTEISVEKNFFARAFTSFSKTPDKVNEGKNNYQFIWQKELQPGESFDVEIKTDYILPIGILLILIFITAVTTFALQQKITVKKRALRVQTKGGEFALKVILTVKAKKDISDITLTDRFPHLTELHERFGTVTPDHIDNKKKIVEWHLTDLHEGEDRIFTYIIYSKIKIIGSILLPAASLIYSFAGKKKQATSNNVYFITQEPH